MGPRKTRMPGGGRKTTVAAEYDDAADFEVLDDAPPTPRRRSVQQSGGAAIWIVSCVAAVLVLSTVAVAVWLVKFKDRDDPAAQVAAEPAVAPKQEVKNVEQPAAPPANAPVVPAVPAANDPKDVPKDVAKVDNDKPVKQAPLQSALIPDDFPELIASHTRAAAAKSVVLLKVTGKDGVSEGSGFLGAEPGLIFTSAHVVGRGSPAIEATFNSGQENQEKTTAVDILGRDYANDLAVLRIRGVKNLPAPLPIALDACSLTENQPVCVLGFPAGTGVARRAEVQDTSVISLRKDADVGPASRTRASSSRSRPTKFVGCFMAESRK
jgi:S1-C subfamily serine protease